jgi:hypothetical protein
VDVGALAAEDYVDVVVTNATELADEDAREAEFRKQWGSGGGK